MSQQSESTEHRRGRLLAARILYSSLSVCASSGSAQLVQAVDSKPELLVGLAETRGVAAETKPNYVAPAVLVGGYVPSEAYHRGKSRGFAQLR
jgi:hypothetical protein